MKSDVGRGRWLTDEEEDTRCPRCVGGVAIRLDAQRQETRQRVVVRLMKRGCAQWWMECAMEDRRRSGRVMPMTNDDDDGW